MALTTQQRDRLQRPEFWQNAVANMETFEIPEGYEAANKTDKYERFTGFLKEWLINLIIIPKNYNETFDDNHPDKEKCMQKIYLYLKAGLAHNSRPILLLMDAYNVKIL